MAQLHRIEDDLRDHAWYEELFIVTIADVEAYVGRWAAFEAAVESLEPPTDSRLTGPLQNS